MPSFFDEPDFLNALFPLHGSFSPDFSLTILRCFLPFRTFHPACNRSWIEKRICPLFQTILTDLGGHTCIAAIAETRVPYGQVALSLCDKLSAGNSAGLILPSRKLTVLFQLPIATDMDRRLTLTSLIQSAFAGSPPGRETARFGEFVYRAREALASDSGQPISPQTRHTFFALPWPFPAFAAEKADCSGSTVGFRGVPILRSGCTKCFAPLAGGGDAASGR
jgi:hypothetical protein